MKIKILLTTSMLILCSNMFAQISVNRYECNRDVQAILIGMIDPTGHNITLKSEGDLKNRLNKIFSLLGNDNVKFASEVVYFSAVVPSRDVGPAMFPIALIKYAKISKDDVFYGVIPFLESENKAVQKKTYDWLGFFEDVEDYQERFLFYEKMLSKDDGKVPSVLINYMYSKSPELALSTMANVYMTKESAAELMKQIKTTPDWKTHSRYKSEKVKSDSKTLTNLSQRPEWWVQLYVAKCVVRDVTPCLPEILKNLKQSKHPLVIQILQEIEAKNEKEKSLEPSKN